MMISREKFERDINQICERSAQIGGDPWILKRQERVPKFSWLEQTSFTVDPVDGKPAKRLFSICYRLVIWGETYGVPVFWFNFYNLDGRLLLLDDFRHFAFANPALVDESSISQNEHPHLGIAFYNLHPCKTVELMSRLNPDNYVLSFLSTIATIFRTDWPLAMFSERREN